MIGNVQKFVSPILALNRRVSLGLGILTMVMLIQAIAIEATYFN